MTYRADQIGPDVGDESMFHKLLSLLSREQRRSVSVQGHSEVIHRSREGSVWKVKLHVLHVHFSYHTSFVTLNKESTDDFFYDWTCSLFNVIHINT